MCNATGLLNIQSNPQMSHLDYVTPDHRHNKINLSNIEGVLEKPYTSEVNAKFKLLNNSANQTLL